MIVKLRKPYTVELVGAHGKDDAVLEVEIPAERTLLASRDGGELVAEMPLKGQGFDVTLRVRLPEKAVEVVLK